MANKRTYSPTMEKLIKDAMFNGADGVYDLLLKAYNDGLNRGREEALDNIFTYHPQEGKYGAELV